MQQLSGVARSNDCTATGLRLRSYAILDTIDPAPRVHVLRVGIPPFHEPIRMPSHASPNPLPASTEGRSAGGPTHGAAMPSPPGTGMVSATIIAGNEGHRISRCLDSIRWVDEIIVVVDDRTTDDTL